MSDARDNFRAAILATFGYAPDVIEPGRMHRFATIDKRGDTAGWCKLFDDLRGGVFGCHRQGISDVWSEADRKAMPLSQRAELARQVMVATAERETEQRKQWAVNARRNAELWAHCVPLVPGDPVTLYLKRRGFAGVWPLPEVLRLHRAMPYWHAGEMLDTFPAMVAPLLTPDGRITALHRTYLTIDGRKADVPTVKKLTLAAGPLAGACIPLFNPEQGSVGIAEGIETALGAWCASTVPTVAAYCADNLAAWRWPATVRRIVIFADADEAGRGSADKLQSRAIAARLRCDVMTPTDAGNDWCDVWAARCAAAVAGAAA